MNQNNRKYRRISVTAALILTATSGYSAGMGLWEWGVPGVAVVSAGSAASALSAASETANPAQASLFDHAELSTGMVFIPVAINFTGDSNFAGFDSYAHNIKTTSNNVVPDLHYIKPLRNNMTLTFGITAPNGLKTDWNANAWNKSPDGFYNISTLSSVKVVDINPGLSYKISPKWAVAFGVNALQGEADYNSLINMGAGESTLTNQLKGTAFDWNAGVLFRPRSSTSFGLSYRSPYTLDASGPSKYTVAGAEPMVKTANANMRFPSKILFSVDQKVNGRLDLLASVFHTQWSQLQSLEIKNTPVPFYPNQIIDMHYKDTNLYSVGALYHYNRKITLMGGVGRDITPVRNGYRDTRLPDANRTDVGLGLAYKINNTSSFDISAQDIISSSVRVDDSSRQPVQPELPTITGTATTKAKIIAFAYNRVFI
jgi:long-chain fatty acid transport protein